MMRRCQRHVCKLWVRTLMADWSSMLPSWMRPTRVSWGMSSYWSLLKGKLIIKF